MRNGFDACDTNDCVRCGCPVCDHVTPFRYAFRCWIRHRRLTVQNQVARRVGRFLDRLWWQM